MWIFAHTNNTKILETQNLSPQLLKNIYTFAYITKQDAFLYARLFSTSKAAFQCPSLSPGEISLHFIQFSPQVYEWDNLT